MYEILLIAAPLGSGKTTALASKAINLVSNGESCLVVQPTKQLNEQTAMMIASMDPSVHVETINGNTCPKRAVISLFNALLRPYDRSHIILTTFSAFINLPRSMNNHRFHLMIDEVPIAFQSTAKQLPSNHDLITDAIRITSCGIAYGEILIEDENTIRKISENLKGDAIHEVLRPFASIIANQNYRNFVEKKQYNDLKSGSMEDPFLRIYSMLNPCTFKEFASVRMYGARAHETILHKWFASQGVVFRDDAETLDLLRYKAHLNGDLIDFYYGSETNWSLYAQESDATIREKIINEIIRRFTGYPFCWLDNKSYEDANPLNGIAGNNKLPHHAHGRNDFQHHDRIAIVTAFNLPHTDANFLADFASITREEQKIAHDYHNTYQTLGRISIRDPNNNNRKVVILPDRQNAEWQSSSFPGSRVHSLGVDDRKPKKKGRVRQYDNATERKQASRNRLEEEQDALVEKYQLGRERIMEAGYQKSCHDISYKDIRKNVTAYKGSIINNTFEGMSFPITITDKEYGLLLKGLHKQVLENKDDNRLIMPALCVPDSNTKRAEQNALWGRHLYFDLDNTELKHRALSTIFPDVEMIVYNSFSHTKEKPRYRAIFLTNDNMTPNVYKFFWYQIVQRIENAGYYGFKDSRPKGGRKPHGIDNKPNVVCAFYLPCQAKSGNSFFRHYIKNRKPIDVREWIKHPITTRFDSDATLEIITAEQADQYVRAQPAMIEAAMAQYRNAINSIDLETGAKIGSNDAMFDLTLKLRKERVDRVDAFSILTQAANESRSPKDRLGDRDRYMKRYW
ncbi:DEAD/DEAH box helicase [Methylobacterium fujisawaense]|uniref:DEAD/DEAH box helicase n=1 Tax=Methylobacterium fujisawaense TaxID=107400 RepID=UPI0031F5BE40